MKTITKFTCPAFAAIALVCFAALSTAEAVSPAPDGGYSGGNTAEGQNALLHLTTGVQNTAVGFLSLKTDTIGSYNTAIGSGTLLTNSADGNTATGTFALLTNSTGRLNTANGALALSSNTIGIGNTAVGYDALPSNTTGNINTAIGESALHQNSTGGGNTATGQFALFENTSGDLNIALGINAGVVTTGSNNIDIGNIGVEGESNTIRIGGDAGLGYGPQTAAFIVGISGTPVVGDPVVVNANGQLGTVSSSRRFKHDITPMDKDSESIFALKPVRFRYKKHIDAKAGPQFGLIAEEVQAINPDLVVRDMEGVRYDQVNAMLLNEFLKEHRTVQELKVNAAKQETNIAQQQKQIEALTAGLQKVTAQLELNKPAPQTVKNND